MNKDQTKGRIEEVKGKVKEIAGQLVGDKELEAKGNGSEHRRQSTGGVWRCEGGPQEGRTRQVKTSTFVECALGAFDIRCKSISIPHVRYLRGLRATSAQNSARLSRVICTARLAATTPP